VRLDLGHQTEKVDEGIPRIVAVGSVWDLLERTGHPA
jgi:hypothetical protein